MSTFVKQNLTYLFFLFLPLLLSAQGKHLFILSGQSNMQALNPKTFTETVGSVFGDEKVIVVKDAKGGKPIRCWFDDWELKAFENPKRNLPNLYTPLISKTKKAIGNNQIATITFVWMQGERDARESLSGAYAENLMRVYKQLVRDLNYENINMVIGRLSDFDMTNSVAPHWTKMRDVQVALANSSPRFGWINTDDLNEGLNFKGKEIKNDLHMSVEGYKKMGVRFAKKSIALIQDNM